MLIEKASPRVQGGTDSTRAMPALDLLDTITKLFPERASAEQRLLSLFGAGISPANAAELKAPRSRRPFVAAWNISGQSI